jgi:hypothetical protein
MSQPITKGVTDLYQAWANAGGSIDFQPDTNAPGTKFLVLYELSVPSNLESEFDKAVAAKKDDAASELATRSISKIFNQIPEQLQLQPIWWQGHTVYGTATVTANGLLLFQKLVIRKLIQRFEISLMPRQSRPKYQYAPPALSKGSANIEKSTGGVLYGVIDHGCPFAHPGLKTSGGKSRLLNIWYQDARTNELASGSPGSWGFGSLATHTNIDAVLAKPENQGIEDWRLYSQLGLKELKPNASHGAHILGDLLNAKSNTSLLWDGVKDRAPIAEAEDIPETPDVVFVQLPDVYVQNLTRCAIAPYRLSALRFILESAGDDTNTIVVPISSEDFVGSHDGTTLFETALDAMVHFATNAHSKTLHVLIAASNSLRLRTHANPAAKASKAASFPFRVYPANELPTFIEIWMRTEDEKLSATIDNLNISIIQSTTKISLDLPLGHGHAIKDTTGKTQIGLVSMGLQGQQVLLVRLPPSFTYDDRVATLPSGDWKISITSKTKAFKAHAYIARSYHGLGGSLRSYQSQFIEPRRPNTNADTLGAADDLFEKFPDYGAGSINGMANGQKVTVIGGYRLWDGWRAAYSGAAPARTGGKLAEATSDYAVDFAAPSDESPSLRGIRSWSNRSGGSFRLDGTSVATPFAARSVAKGNITLPNTVAAKVPATGGAALSPPKKPKDDPKIPPKKIFFVPAGV